MSEAVVVYLFLFFRVLLVGGILLVLPRVTRKGLLFGVYVGEVVDEDEAARRLVSRWNSRCVLLMVLSLLVGLAITLAGRPVTGNLTGTAVLLMGAVGLFYRFHSEARGLEPPEASRQAGVATAPLRVGAQTAVPDGEGLAKLCLGICVAVSLATVAYVTVAHDREVGVSFGMAMLPPSLNLVFSTFLALMALLTANAKRSFRGGSGGRSVEAQEAFRSAWSRFLSWAALVLCAHLGLVSVQIIRVGLERSTGVVFIVGALAVIAFLGGGWFRIVKKYGQGGALIEEGSAEAPLTNGLADNDRWLWGIFYIDRDDPSIMVEKRFGLGYDFNLGNRTAILILAVWCTLGLALGVLTMIALSQVP